MCRDNTYYQSLPFHQIQQQHSSHYYVVKWLVKSTVRANHILLKMDGHGVVHNRLTKDPLCPGDSCMDVLRLSHRRKTKSSRRITPTIDLLQPRMIYDIFSNYETYHIQVEYWLHRISLDSLYGLPHRRPIASF